MPKIDSEGAPSLSPKILSIIQNKQLGCAIKDTGRQFKAPDAGFHCDQRGSLTDTVAIAQRYY